tara:strand:- start:169 stop:420 length:252 start_codon:yes stop_codon:yes gene_type:complete
MQFNEWTKKLGQQHWSDPNSHTTLCGKPMLGNNYANHIEEENKTACQVCLKSLHNNFVETDKLNQPELINNLNKAGLNVIVFD